MLSDDRIQVWTKFGLSSLLQPTCHQAGLTLACQKKTIMTVRKEAHEREAVNRSSLFAEFVSEKWEYDTL